MDMTPPVNRFDPVATLDVGAASAVARPSGDTPAQRAERPCRRLSRQLRVAAVARTPSNLFFTFTGTMQGEASNSMVSLEVY
jgi:hypothetical protein